MSVVALSEILGAAVRDGSGSVRGRVREIAVAPQDHPTRVAFLVVRTPEGDRMLPAVGVRSYGATVRTASESAGWDAVHGFRRRPPAQTRPPRSADHRRARAQGRAGQRCRAYSNPVNGHIVLDVLAVDVGARGAIRRLVKGLVPSFTLRALLEKVPPRVIPWQYVDLIETDPARRVKLKIAYEGLSRMHPADIADIVEDLAPAEQKAVFEALDEEVAAEALEEIDPDIQVSIVESLDSNRAADIVEEMDPDAAADLLGDLTEDRSDEILKEMQPEERQEVTQLLEFGEHTAAGRMTTEYIAVSDTGIVADAIEALRQFEGSSEAVATIYLTGPDNARRRGAARARSPSRLRRPAAQFAQRASSPPARPTRPSDEVAELFDKYNLITLAVVDEHGRLSGIITADDVISMLRHRD